MVLLFSLLGGLAIALTFQLMLANLGLALGLTILDFSPASSLLPAAPAPTASSAPTASPSHTEGREDANSSTDASISSAQGLSLPLTHLLGVGVALSATSAIFAAALIGTEFSAIADLRRGIIFSLMTWAIYWLLFIWLSTTTLSSIADSLFGAVVSSGRKLLSLAKKVSPLDSSANSEDAESMLQALSAELSDELSQIADAQKALPKLLENHRAQLIEEVGDRTRLSAQQIETVLSDIVLKDIQSQPVPESSPETTTSSISSSGLMASLGSKANSTMRSVVESQLDIPSWQQISRKVIDNVDLSTVSSFLPPIQDDSKRERSEISAADKAIQKNLINYCRYTNSSTLTPDSLLEKIEAQKEEWNVEVISQRQVDVDAIANVIDRRKTLPAAEKQALIDTLKSAVLEPDSMKTAHLESANLESANLESANLESANLESASPAKFPVAAESAPLSEAINQAKSKIAHYLHAQDKTNLQPKQIAQDLTHIIGSSLQSIPHPSQLPELSQLETLWDGSAWQQTLSNRKDMSADEIKQVLQWLEASWEPVHHQTGIWLESLQSEASQLLDVPEEVIDEVRQQVVEQTESAKETVEERVIAIKTELQVQADGVRKQSAIAAWWLFFALFLSSAASGGAGWLAVRY